MFLFNIMPLKINGIDNSEEDGKVNFYVEG